MYILLKRKEQKKNLDSPYVAVGNPGNGYEKEQMMKDMLVGKEPNDFIFEFIED